MTFEWFRDDDLGMSYKANRTIENFELLARVRLDTTSMPANVVYSVRASTASSWGPQVVVSFAAPSVGDPIEKGQQRCEELAVQLMANIDDLWPKAYR